MHSKSKINKFATFLFTTNLKQKYVKGHSN